MRTYTTALNENISKILQDIDLGKNLLVEIQKSQEMKVKADKWECVKLQNHCRANTVKIKMTE